MMNMTELQSRIRATFWLAAIGDALGMPAEKMTPEEIGKAYGQITTYFDAPKGHRWLSEDMKAGMWTDDSQLMLAIAESLIRSGGIDMNDIARSHVVALEESTFGWGGSTTEAVKKIQAGTHWSESGILNAAGNGISMKIAPLGLLLVIDYLNKKASEEFLSYSSYLHDRIVEIARMTHQSSMAIASGLAQVYAVFASALLPEEKFAEKFLKMVIEVCRLGEKIPCGDTLEDRLSERLEHLLVTRNYERMSVRELAEEYGGKGKARFYVLNSLTLSYAIFLRNPESVVTLFDAVRAGGDTDTNASMVGALLGARNGMGILSRYTYLIEGLWRKEKINEVTEKFCDTFIPNVRRD